MKLASAPLVAVAATMIFSQSARPSESDTSAGVASSGQIDEVIVTAQKREETYLPDGGTLTPTAWTYWQSSNYLREFNLPIDRVGAYSNTDANLTYADPSRRWKLQGYVRSTLRLRCAGVVNDPDREARLFREKAFPSGCDFRLPSRKRSA
jgi:hypothetical protein